MKKINITSFVLLAYLIVMSVIGWPGRIGAKLAYSDYYCMIGATLLVIVLLRLVQIRRLKVRKKEKENNNSYEH
ncbi:MAG: hypothetical protein LBV32_09500 [Tannerellaceae bacterium]|jgi:4-hydroxybenzoate polyprenyltransferase|nr:hypothetical protein [Tannerellaceae bacterium]